MYSLLYCSKGHLHDTRTRFICERNQFAICAIDNSCLCSRREGEGRGWSFHCSTEGGGRGGGGGRRGGGREGGRGEGEGGEGGGHQPHRKGGEKKLNSKGKKKGGREGGGGGIRGRRGGREGWN